MKKIKVNLDILFKFLFLSLVGIMFWPYYIFHEVHLRAKIAFLTLSLLLICPAFGQDFEYSLKHSHNGNYAIIAKSNIDGEFKGCSVGEVYNLKNGAKFKCQDNKIVSSDSPDFYIIRNLHTHNLKIYIDKNEYNGVYLIPKD